MEIEIAFLYLVLLFLVSSLYLTDAFNSYGAVAIASILMLSFLYYLLKKDKTLKLNMFLLVSTYFLVISASFSALSNQDFQLLLMPITLFVLLIASSILGSMECLNQKIYKAVLYSHIPLIFVPFLINGLSTPYRGIFYNPNAFGSVVTTVFVAVFSVFLYNLDSYLSNKKEKRLKSKMFIQLLILMSLLFMVVISSSRTSFLAIGLVCGIGLFFVLVRLIKQRKLVSFIFKGSFLAGALSVVAFIFLKVTSFYDYLHMNILYKFELKSDDTLSERGTVWNKTIDQASVLGSGSDYFSNNVGIGAHNTFIGILGEYGWIVLILFSIIILYLTISSIKYTKVDSKYKYFPLMMIVGFMTLSVGEGMMFKLSMIVAFISTSSISKTIKVNEEIKNEKNIPSINGQIN